MGLSRFSSYTYFKVNNYGVYRCTFLFLIENLEIGFTSLLIFENHKEGGKRREPSSLSSLFTSCPHGICTCMSTPCPKLTVR